MPKEYKYTFAPLKVLVSVQRSKAFLHKVQDAARMILGTQYSPAPSMLQPKSKPLNLNPKPGWDPKEPAFLGSLTMISLYKS